MTVAELGEHALLARVRAQLPPPGADVRIGIGDDAAVVEGPRNEQLVLTTDAIVAGVHFSQEWSTPADIGHKALAVNLSDLAAMGAEPRWALLSLIVPDATDVDHLDQLIRALATVAHTHRIAIVGGNIARTNGPMVIDITAVGTVRPRRVLTRSGARPGDELYVSGTLGASAAGLEMLRAGVPGDTACIARHRRPEPRLAIGLAIARTRAARAAMDLSDGLADGVRQIAEASGCGADIDGSALPIEPGAVSWWRERGVDPVVAAMAGGEDYELLVAVPPTWRGRLRHARRRASEPALTKIGVLTKDTSTLTVTIDGQPRSLPRGFEHFPC